MRFVDLKAVARTVSARLQHAEDDNTSTGDRLLDVALLALAHRCLLDAMGGYPWWMLVRGESEQVERQPWALQVR